MRLHPTLLLVILAHSLPAIASSARFIHTTNILQLDCVRLLDEGDRTLAVDLRYDGSNFNLLSTRDIDPDISCPTSFSSQSSLLSAEVRVLDDVFKLELKYEGGTSFWVHTAQNLGVGESLIWSVSNGTNEVVIGGTVHILKQTDFPLPSLYTEAFNQADILVTEISGAEFNNTLSILPFLSNPSGTSSLRDALNPATYEQLSIFFQDLDTPISTYENIRPVWVAQDILTLAYRELGYGNGVDLHFIELAQSRGIPSRGLETALDQVFAVNQTRQHLTSEQLISETLSLVQSDAFGADIQKLINAWREGDSLELIDTVINPARAESPNDYNIVFTDRNMNWAQQIEAYLLTAEKEFVLVGVGHLVGPENLLQLLEQSGLEVSKF